MNSLLLQVIVDPSRVEGLSAGDWDRLIPQARNSHLLATLYSILEREGLLAQIPERPRNHLFSDTVRHRQQKASLDYETHWLLRALKGMDVPLVFLKGGAYIQAGLPASQGRLISDIDLMVPKARIQDVEEALNRGGWESVYADEYDQRFYREWMHEVPPLSHLERGSTLDLHHTIVPPTTSPHTDAGKLFENLRELRPGLFVLCPVDMVIHSATHLFHEGEFHHGFRDVCDLDRLLREFAADDAGFWDALVARAVELDLQKSVFYALRYSQRIFGTPVPSAVLETSGRGIARKPLVPLMDFLFMRALAPDHFSCEQRFSKSAKFCLYIRSHYLRMPMRLLLPHLLRKAWKRRFGPKGSDTEDWDQGEA